jgi:nitroreductase
MMDFLDLAQRRYSCRKYDSRKVDPAQLALVMEAGRIAPSACNYQPWYFIVVENPDNLAKVKNCYAKSWLESAPMLIVICGDHSRSWKRDDGKDHCDIDIAIAVDHMTLAASSLGLATCWVCKFDAVACSKLLGLPDHIEPMVLLPIGYPADFTDPGRHASLRKTIEEFVRFERW